MLIGLPTHWADTKIVVTFHLGPIALDGSTKFYSLWWYVIVLGGTGNEGFDCASGVFSHLVWPFEVWLILDLF